MPCGLEVMEWCCCLETVDGNHDSHLLLNCKMQCVDKTIIGMFFAFAGMGMALFIVGWGTVALAAIHMDPSSDINQPYYEDCRHLTKPFF